MRTLARQTGTACVDLTPEATEGPYYLPNELVRKDIREDQEGFELALTFRVMNSLTCRPIKRAAVDIWHCNALGVYSGVAQQAEGEQPADSNTFLRGVQLTDQMGRCTITTIIPGWYPGRAVHIHLKVHVGGAVQAHHYDGGHISHTGQVFFAESLLGKIEDLDPYRQDTAERPSNDSDQIYHQAGGTSAIVTTKAIVKGDPSQGYTGVMILGIEP